jgi:hypothetical protein
MPEEEPIKRAHEDEHEGKSPSKKGRTHAKTPRLEWCRA